MGWVGEGRTHVGPDGHDEDHGNRQRVVEDGVATDLAEAVAVVEGDGSGLAELGVDGVGVARDAIDVGGGNLDDVAVLHEDLVHAVGLEAGDDAGSLSAKPPLKKKGESGRRRGNSREGLAGVDGLALAVEVGVAEAVRVVVAAVGVAVAGEPVVRVGATALVLNADVVFVAVVAGVGGEGEGVRVGLPDVDLGTAGAHATDTGTVVGVRGLPALNVALWRLLVPCLERGLREGEGEGCGQENSPCR